MSSDPTLWDGMICIALWCIGLYSILRRDVNIHLMRKRGIKLHYLGLGALLFGTGALIAAGYASYMLYTNHNNIIPEVVTDWRAFYFGGIIAIMLPTVILSGIINGILSVFRK